MKTKIAIIGLGYVGLPLFLNFSKKFDVVGYDKNKKRVEELNKLNDQNNEFNKTDIKKVLKNSLITNNVAKIEKCNFYILTIPTPIYKNKSPDLRLLNSALYDLCKFIKKNDVIIIESTVYPGYCDEIAIPIIEKNTKLNCNKDFIFGYSPERVNPGDKINKINNIVKIVASSNYSKINMISKIYKLGLDTKIHNVKSIKIAESAKIIENTQRDLNVALINEFSIFLEKFNIPYEEVMNAAKTKWNFLNFERGLVGGHCISVDPYYLIYKANKIGIKTKIISEARKINDKMPNYFSKFILNKIKKKNPKILVLGLSFKKNCNDIRNSFVFDLSKTLKKNNCKVQLYDPIVDPNDVKSMYNTNMLKKLPNLINFDFLVVAKKHNIFYKNQKYLSIIKRFRTSENILEI